MTWLKQVAGPVATRGNPRSCWYRMAAVVDALCYQAREQARSRTRVAINYLHPMFAVLWLIQTVVTRTLKETEL